MISPQEHKLMIGMFTQQTLILKSLVTLLGSRGVLESDDLEAFVSLTASQEDADPEISRAVVNRYKSLAQVHGVNLEVNFP